MTEAEQTANRIRIALPNIKCGTLRFWGSWFGQPYDNRHQIVDCEAEGQILLVRFDQSELLSVFSPRNASINEKRFRIDDADRARVRGPGPSILVPQFHHRRPRCQPWLRSRQG